MTTPFFAGQHYPVIVVGGGQAGLSASYWLCRHDIDHLVLEKHQAFHAWKNERWDSFSLVTPNWQCRLPGHPYDGDDPDGFMVKDQIVAWMERFRAAFSPPLREGVTVQEVTPRSGGGYRVRTDRGALSADRVIMAVSVYHQPKVPPCADALPDHLTQLDASAYRNPDALPEGPGLVVGTGQSGCQIAEDLHLAGREVHLAVGPAPRVSRFYRGRDVVAWLDDMGHYRIPVREHLSEDQVKAKANHYVTGRDGGRDIDLRRFALEGMRLYGRLEDLEGGRILFGHDLRENLDNADATNARIKASIDEHIARHNIDAPAEAPYRPVWEPAPDHPTSLDLKAAGITTVTGASATRRISAGSRHRPPSTTAATRNTSAASPPAPASTSWACPGSTPGAPDASTPSPRTPNTWSTTWLMSSVRAGRAGPAPTTPHKIVGHKKAPPKGGAGK